MKKVLITGADGRIGGTLVRRLLDETDFSVVGVSFTREMFDGMLDRMEIRDRSRTAFLSHEEFLSPDTPLDDLYAAVHLAFSRRNCPAADIASSIDFASAVFGRLAVSGAERVINLSSQGVYGKTEEFRTEDTPPAPETQYTMAKYAAEVIFNTHFGSGRVPDYANLRLDPVVQSQNLVIALCKQAKEGKISLRGGEQRFSFIDVEDAASALTAMLLSPAGWAHTYNVGWNRMRFTLTEVADHVAAVSERLGFGRPEITLEKQDIVLWAGLDSTRFSAHTGWKPEISFDQMIERIFGTL